MVRYLHDLFHFTTCSMGVFVSILLPAQWVCLFPFYYLLNGCVCFHFTTCSMGVFVYVEVLQPSQPNGAMLRVVSLSNYTFTGQA